MKNKTGANVLILLGVLLILASAALTVRNLQDSSRAGEASQEVAEELMARIADGARRPAPTPLPPPSDGEAEPPEMPVMLVDENGYVGVLEIPALGLTLPVAAEWDYRQLNTSPCRYSGTAAGKDLILCAHNYYTHFGQLLNVDMETEVYFTAVDGTVYRYLVANREILEPTAVEKMMENERGGWALTLFTCTIGGASRCAVRCVEYERTQAPLPTDAVLARQ